MLNYLFVNPTVVRIMPIIKDAIIGLEEAVSSYDYSWKTVGVKDDVLIMKKEPKDGVLFAFKGIGEINAPPEQVKVLS